MDLITEMPVSSAALKRIPTGTWRNQNIHLDLGLGMCQQHQQLRGMQEGQEVKIILGYRVSYLRKK